MMIHILWVSVSILPTLFLGLPRLYLSSSMDPKLRRQVCTAYRAGAKCWMKGGDLHVKVSLYMKTCPPRSSDPNSALMGILALGNRFQGETFNSIWVNMPELYSIEL